MKKVIWLCLSFLILGAMLLASCSTSSTTSTTTTTSTKPPTTITTTTITTNTPPTTTTTKATTTTSTTGNWWDKLGKPTYGGSLNLSSSTNITGFDDYNAAGQTSFTQAWEDTLTSDNWALDPSTFAYQLAFRPNSYEVGNLAQDWEFTDPNNYVVHLRQGIHYQNIPPVNGREFTSADIVYHFDRRLGLGDGFTKPSPYYAADAAYNGLKSVTAPDKYTVVFTWQGTSEESICETLQGGGGDENIEAPEVVQQYGSTLDWHHAIGTGPFILQDFVSDSSMTLVKNPNYWAFDERYPQNQLPYINQLNILIIPDQATQLAGLRTGKLDVLDNLSLSQAQATKKTNPEIMQITYPGNTPTIDPKNDVKPFTDIRVRQAMQMALDLPTIAATYYAGTCPPYPSTMTSMYMTGWTYPYSQWPQSLKDSYAYNPTAAKQLLAAAGFPNGFNTDVVAANNNDLDLLQIVKSYFAAVGINMSITTMDFASWNTFVRAKKDDQLAYNNTAGFSFPPLMGFRRFQTGSGNNWCDVSDPAWDALYAKALAATNLSDTQSILVQGNTYMAAQHWEISLCTPNLFALYQPWLKGYSGQSFSISGSGGATGPLWVGFYCARFWIDSNLKTSMGH